MRLIHLLTLFLTLLAASVPATGRTSETPAGRFRHAQLHDLGSPADLSAAFRDLARRIDEPAWVVYAVPRTPELAVRADEHHDGCGTYYLEERDQNREGMSRGRGEPGDALVLLRVAGGEIVRISVADVECTVDAGGLPVHLFSGVEARQSLDLLVAAVTGPTSRRLARMALHAIAVHDEPAADALLERVATGELSWDAENQAVFWLGAARGQRGFEILRRLAGHEDPRLREHVTFALHVSHASEAVEVLAAMARHDAHSRVRRQAIFWLAQEAGRRAVAELERAAEGDPDVGVKKHAIFALSQLPADEGVPLLIRYARTHPSPEVRRQAMFWLGQSGDERALEFLEEVLLDRAP